MVSKTAAGLVKTSVQLDEDLLADIDRLARDRGKNVSRSDAMRDLVRLGMPAYEQQTAVLKSMTPMAAVRTA